jgi:hypothetical protein
MFNYSEADARGWNLIAVNEFFFFSGICLNSLVILTFWRSVQLRKKLCYFMIMVLSCCDLLAVLTNSRSIDGPYHDVMVDGKVGCKCKMALYFLKIDMYFPRVFIIRSLGDEFRSIFGDILSYLSSNIGNEVKTFNSSCNTDHRRRNYESDDCKRLCYFLPRTYSNTLYSSHSSDVIYQLQTVSSREKKS